MNPYGGIAWAWLLVLAIWVVTSLWSKTTVRRQSNGSRLLQLALGLVAALFLMGDIWVGPQIVPHRIEIGWIGCAITLAGLAFSLWARFVLGRNWSGAVTVKEGHELVRTGPYRIVRHPIYSGFLLAILGTALAAGTVGSFIGLVLAAITLRFKSRTEENLMTAQFGAEYTEYQRQTHALIPFLW